MFYYPGDPTPSKSPGLFLMIYTIVLLSNILFSDSLTISPAGFTYHLIETPGASQMPYSIGSKDLHPLVFNPEANFLYTTKYFEYDAFWMKDCNFNDSYGLLLGPKYDLTKYLTSGMMLGTYFRDQKSPNGDLTLGKLHTYNIIPIYGITGSLSYPSSISPSIDLLLNHKLLHTAIGIKITL